jgi:hypothetical protein
MLARAPSLTADGQAGEHEAGCLLSRAARALRPQHAHKVLHHVAIQRLGADGFAASAGGELHCARSVNGHHWGVRGPRFTVHSQQPQRSAHFRGHAAVVRRDSAQRLAQQAHGAQLGGVFLQVCTRGPSPEQPTSARRPRRTFEHVAALRGVRRTRLQLLQLRLGVHAVERKAAGVCRKEDSLGGARATPAVRARPPMPSDLCRAWHALRSRCVSDGPARRRQARAMSIPNVDTNCVGNGVW